MRTRVARAPRQKQGKLDEAKQLHERARNVYEAVHGPDHPDVALACSNIAGVHFQRGETAEAKPLFERALTIRSSVLGPDHPQTKSSADYAGKCA